MAAFAKRFDVDLRDFHPELHFAREESTDLASMLLDLLGHSKQLLPITVQDLMEAVQHARARLGSSL